jgi:tetratricopeptide (TPR) repeat protein
MKLVFDHPKSLKDTPSHFCPGCHHGLIQRLVAEAIDHYELAIAASPDYAPAHNNLGNAFGAQGKPDEAVFAYEEALRADPGFEQASKNLDDARKESEGLRE